MITYRGYDIERNATGLYEWTDEQGRVHNGKIDTKGGFKTEEAAMDDIDAYKRSAQERHTVEPSTKWLIWVSGYGRFDFDGAETEAEEMRRHKASWEGGQGRKWRADLSRESDRLTAEIVDLWSSHQGVPQSLMSRLKKAIDAEATGADQ